MTTSTKILTFCSVTVGLASISHLQVAAAQSDQNPNSNPQHAAAMPSTGNRAMLDQSIAQWPARPKLGAEMMIAKYGLPQEVTGEKLTWHNAGLYKRITVTKTEDHHDFPLPHTDFMEHTVNYNVPANKADELSKFDGSCTFDRTRGELSARCDLEGHNILTLNLANDIVTGKKDSGDARKAFSQIVVEDMLGKHPAYVEALQFKPPMTAAFSDQPTIPGSPMRPDERGAKIQGSSSDGEVLGFISAIDLNEVSAAMVASTKNIRSEVAEYAKMLHQHHGENLQQTLKLGEKIHVTPLITPTVDALRIKGAGELATLVPLDGEQFERGYLMTMVKGHTEALDVIDKQLLPKSQSEALKKHLSQTRESVAAHLEAARQMQGVGNVGAPEKGVRSGTGSGQSQPNPAQRIEK